MLVILNVKLTVEFVWFLNNLYCLFQFFRKFYIGFTVSVEHSITPVHLVKNYPCWPKTFCKCNNTIRIEIVSKWPPNEIPSNLKQIQA